MDPAAETPDVAYRFRALVLGLAQLVANQFSKDPSNEPFIFRIYTSLRRRLTRFERVFARAQAELHSARDVAQTGVAEAGAAPAEAVVEPSVAAPAPMKRSPATTGAGVDRKPVRKPYHRLPRKRAWMLIMMPHQAALYWYRLDDLLRDPEMVAFLAISPKARRLLRPLWYGLCGDPLPACLREPPKPVKALLAPAVAALGAVAERRVGRVTGSTAEPPQQAPPRPGARRRAWSVVPIPRGRCPPA